MAKKSRLGTDPLSWIKDSRKEEKKEEEKEEVEKLEAPKAEKEKEESVEEAREEEMEKLEEPEPEIEEPIGEIEEETEYGEPEEELEEYEEEHDVYDEEEFIDEEFLEEEQEEDSDLQEFTIARREEPEKKLENGEFQLVIFKLNQQKFAIEVDIIKEIVSERTITSVPGAPFGVAGIINLRSMVIPVFNLKKSLELEETAYADQSPIIILQNEEHLTGVLVDEVIAAKVIKEDQLEEAPETIRDEVVSGVVKLDDSLITLIDAGRVVLQGHKFSKEREREFSEKEILDEEGTEEMRQFVSFYIRNDEFALAIKEVKEINKVVPIAPVPHSPKFVEGVINLRGQIVPVINLRQRFNIEKAEYDKNTRIIVIQTGNKYIGFVVDSVSEVLRTSLSSIKPPPREVVMENMKFVRGIAEVNERLVIVLNLEKVLSTKEVKNISEIKQAIQENSEQNQQI